jgi:hypothetical protein
MAISTTATFRAAPDAVWRAVLQLVREAGYPVTGTNQAARQIQYQASGGAFAWTQEVEVSICEAGDGETMLTVTAKAAGAATLAQGGQQRKLVGFVLTELGKKFPLVEGEVSSVKAPGTSGCLGGVVLLVAGACSLVRLVV